MSWLNWLGLGDKPVVSTETEVMSRAHDNAQIALEAGMADATAGRHAAAVSHFERALEIAPDFAPAHRELGRARLELGDAEAAADSLELAAHFDPRDAWPLFLLGLIAQRRGEPEAAATLYERALALDTDFVEAHNNLGYLLVNVFERIEDGEAHFDAALRVRPGYRDALINQGIADLHSGRREEAIARFGNILEREPSCDEARLNRAIARLALGQWHEAWDEYEARKKAGPHWIKRPFSYPEWDGASAPDKTLLVYAEQGLGDEIMFASCLADALARVGRVVVDCSPKLAPLIARGFPQCLVHGGRQNESGDWTRNAPPIGLQIAMGSLPRLFRRTASAFPAHQGYLAADPAKVEAWRAKLGTLGPRKKIVLSWRGGTPQTRQARRSVPVDSLGRALRRVDADFISLQYGPVDDDIAIFAAAGVMVHHWPEAIADYDETAALLCSAELTLSICTALIHLGGALGRPTWVLVPVFPEWRYGDAGETMPWYPSVRLFRQRQAGDWQAVLSTVARELELRVR
jgi:tetratricopeptide (TPR) repeat protein